MPSSKDVLLKTGLFLLATGALIFFHPYYVEPMWLEWVVGPVLVYLGLPLAMVGIGVHFFGDTHKTPASLSKLKARG